MSNNNNMKKRTITSSLPLSLSTITFSTITLLCIVFIVSSITSGRVNAYERGSPYYDPELQDGIPVMSAKSSMPASWNHNSLKGVGNDFDDNPMVTRRRSSDADLEDNLEEDDDDDRDDYNKAGSNNHDSYENPAFGESRRAEKDGDDIENFFDKHLGPPQDALDEASSNSEEIPVSEISRNLPSRGGDYDDQYEAAASSPLTNIIQSIVKAHKRPLIITTEEAPSSASSSSSSESSSTSTTTKDHNGASSTSPIGLSIIRTSPSSAGSGSVGSPIAYFAPMIAAPSTLNGYEQQDYSNSNSNNDAGQDDGVREIIITRRPSSSTSSSFISHLQGYSPSGRLTHQSSNDNWQGAMAPNVRNPYDGEQSDYSRYPVAASYAYQREQQQQQQPEEQTISYGLSFGAANDDDSNQEEQTSSDEPVQPQPIGAASYPIYNSRNSAMRNSASMLRPYQNYNYQPMYNNPAMYNNQAMYNNRQQQYYQQQMMQQQQQQQSPYNGARYHKDPSESVTQPVSYMSGGQYSQPVSQTDNKNNSWQERQRLLANLDREIKNSPNYVQQSSNNYNRQQLLDRNQYREHPGNNYPQRTGSRRFVIARIPIHRQQQQQQQQQHQHQHLLRPTGETDVDTYSSFHSEIDPYKSFTSSSRIISEPVVENTLQSGSYKSPLSNGDLINKNNSALIDNNSLYQQNALMNYIDNSNSNSYNKNNNNNIIQADNKANNNGASSLLQQDSTMSNNNNIINNNNNNNLLTGPIVNKDSQQNQINHRQQQFITGDIMRDNKQTNELPNMNQQINSRVRREDSDDRESDDADDDGVWVDDDEDDDNRQQSSDLNETSQEPEEEDSQQDEIVDRAAVSPPGVIGGPHSYELSPDDLLVYHG